MFEIFRVTRHLRGQAELGPEFRQGFSGATANAVDPLAPPAGSVGCHPWLRLARWQVGAKMAISIVGGGPWLRSSPNGC